MGKLTRNHAITGAFCLFLLLAGLALGIVLQKNHGLTPLKRAFRGLPFKVPAPNTEILQWNESQFERPQYALDGLTLSEIESNRRVYQEKSRELLGFSRYPLQYRPSIEITERTKLKGLTREKILIETEPGLKIPFYLFLPENAPGALPVILVLHGHSAGKIETAGLLESYQHGNALALAQAGYITAAPDFRGFGELGWQGNWEDPIGHAYGRNIHIMDVLSNLQRGRTVLGTYLYDLRHILDYLKTRGSIDQQKIGIAGTSMGADTALWLSILFPEINAAVISHPSMLGLPQKSKAEDSEHPCIGTIPHLALFFKAEEIPLLAAPTPMQITYHASPTAEVNKKRLEWLYQTSGNADKISFHSTQSGEDFDNEAAIAWFKKWLK